MLRLQHKFYCIQQGSLAGRKFPHSLAPGYNPACIDPCCPIRPRKGEEYMACAGATNILPSPRLNPPIPTSVASLLHSVSSLSNPSHTLPGLHGVQHSTISYLVGNSGLPTNAAKKAQHLYSTLSTLKGDRIQHLLWAARIAIAGAIQGTIL